MLDLGLEAEVPRTLAVWLLRERLTRAVLVVGLLIQFDRFLKVLTSALCYFRNRGAHVENNLNPEVILVRRSALDGISYFFRKRVIFLFLTGCWISVSFLATNLVFIKEPAAVIAVGVAIGLAAGGTYVLLSLVFSDNTNRRLFGMLVGMVIVLNLFGVIFDLTFRWISQSYYLSGKISIAIWLVTLVLTATVLWFTITNTVRETALKTTICILLAVAVFEGFWRGSHLFLSQSYVATEDTEQTPETFQIGKKNISLPNIYYIVLDAYVRPDMLNRLAGLDVTGFLENLSDFGFKIPKMARSNYMTTSLSIGHTLLGDYYVVDEGTRENYLLGHGPPSAAEEGLSPVIERLRSIGYAFHRLGNCNGQEDHCLSSYLSFPTEVIEVLANTPLLIVLRYVYPKVIRQNRAEETIPLLFEKLSQQSDVQKFVFAHILYPHDRVFDSDCNRIAEHVEGWMAARTMKDRMLKDKQAYRGTVACVNRQLEEGLKEFLADSSPKIIVLAADHGTAFTVPSGVPAVDWPEEAIIERTAIFNAWKLPLSCQEHLYDDITPVNHFELIFACLSATEPKFLPDHTYASYYHDTEVERVPNSIFENN